MFGTARSTKRTFVQAGLDYLSLKPCFDLGLMLAQQKRRGRSTRAVLGAHRWRFFGDFKAPGVIWAPIIEGSSNQGRFY